MSSFFLINFKITITQKKSRKFIPRSTQKEIEPSATFLHHWSVMCQCLAYGMFERLWDFLFL